MYKLTRTAGALLAVCMASTAGARERRLRPIDLSDSRPASAKSLEALRDRAKALAAARGAQLRIDENAGVPRFFQAGAGEDGATGATRSRYVSRPDASARAYLKAHADLYALSSADVDAAELVATHDLGEGPVIASFARRIGGIEVFRNQLKVLMDRDQNLVALSGHLVPSAVASRGAGAFRLSGAEAISRAFEDLTDVALPSSELVSEGGRDEGGYQKFSLPTARSGLVFASPARFKPVLFDLGNALEPGYYVEVDVGREGSRDSDAYGYVISAVDGRLLFRKDLAASTPYNYRVFADPTYPYIPFDGPQGNGPTPHPTGIPDGYQAPWVSSNLLTSIDFVKPSAASTFADAWIPSGTASTNTTGNNVDAYADLVSADGFNNGDLRANTSSNFTFDYTFDPNQQPNVSQTQQKAAIVQLFYLNNFFHDWYYDAGFNEAAGNAQTNNYGRGGLGNDSIKAEAQDYSGTDNANMSTPADGSRPRMQMYVFTGNGGGTLQLTAPASLVGSWGGGNAGFGPQVFNTSPAKNIVLAVDGTADVNDGCETITNGAQLSGKIALIHRGTCAFTVKVKNAQNAGAAAVLISNNQPGILDGLGGTDSTITIGTLGITQDEGGQIETALASGPVSGIMSRVAVNNRDGTIDGQIVAHEWGHYISNRLIGNGSGLNNNQGGSMGEGWGDFHALLMTVRASDTSNPTNTSFNGVYGLAGYVTSGGVNNGYYYGIRRVPYSTDLNKNGLTFAHIQDYQALPANVPTSFGITGADNSEVHNSGEVWATMLWECYAGILRDTLGASPRLTFSQAQDRMKKYLVAGYKLTPPNPTFIDARDALLTAVQAGDASDYLRCRAGFAKRGMGPGAVGPDNQSADNTPVVESFSTDIQFVSATLAEGSPACDGDGIVDNGEAGTLNVTLKNVGLTALASTTVTVSNTSSGVSFPNGTTITFPSIAPNATATAGLRVTLSGVTGVQTLAFALSMTDGSIAPTTYSRTVQVLANVDRVVGSTATDDVELGNQGWTITGTPAGAAPWAITAASDTAHSWSNSSSGATDDQSLVSPSFTVGTTQPTITLSHRFRFEEGTNAITGAVVYYDGGVIECSKNGGAWTAVDDGNYTAPIRKLANSNSQPLKSRQAFAGMSAGYPAFVTQTFTAPTACTGGSIQFRFRVGSDANTHTAGWEIASIAFTGTNNAFASYVADVGGGCANVAPVANAGPDQAVNEGSSATLDGTGSFDSNGDLITYQWTGPAGITLTGANTATPTFTAPIVNVDTNYTFTLTVRDPGGLTSTDTVVVTVRNQANVAPVANAGPDQTVNERATVTLAGSGTDANGDALTYQWTAPAGIPLSPSATVAGPSFIAPDVLTAQSYTFTLTVRDSGGLTSSDTVVITVNPVNRAPVAAAGADQSVGERTTVTLNGSGSSDPDSGAPDNDVISYSWTQVGGPSVSITGATTATPSFTAPDVAAATALDFRLTVSDREGASSSDTVRITVNNVNRPPVANAGPDQTVNERSLVTLAGSGTDPDSGAPDNDTLTYAWTVPAGIVLSNPSSATPTFTAPDVLSATSYDLTLTVTDKLGASSTDVVRVTVNGVNRAPTANAGPDQTANERSTVSLSGSGTDPDAGAPDNDAIASYAWTGPAGITLTGANTATPSFTAPNVAGPTALDFTLTVTDKFGATGSDTVRVTVNNVNRAPVANAGPDASANERTSVTLNGSASSDPDSGAPDNDTITYAWTPPAGITLTGATTATPSFTAPDVAGATALDFSLTVTDKLGATSTDTVRITVNNVNRAPTANAGPDQTVNERSLVSLSGSGTDPDAGAPDNDTLSFAWSAPAGITLTGANTAAPTFTAPDVASATTYDVTLTVTDKLGATGTDVVRVTVNAVNRAPTANAGADASANERTVVTLSGSGTDPDAGAPDNDAIASYAWTGPAGITLTGANTAAPSFTAPDVAGATALDFTLTVTDGSGATGTDTVRITVNNVNRAPVANAGSDAIAIERTVFQLNGSGSDPDSGAPDNDAVVAYQWTSPAGVTLSDPTAASPTFTAPNVVGDTPYVFTLTVFDRSGASASDTVTITVRNQNRAPVADAGADFAIDEGAAGTLAGSATDADGDFLLYRWTQLSGPTATITDPTSATTGFTAPTVATDETLVFQLEATDSLDTAIDTVTVTVRQVNQAPVANAGADQVVDERSAVALDGSASSDPDGDTLSYQWAQVSGTQVMLSSTTDAQPTFTAPDVTMPETLVFSLVVSDPSGASSPAAQVSISVNNVNRRPTARVGPAQTIVSGADVTLDGTGSDDPDGETVTWSWTQTSGPAVTLSDATAASPTFTAPTVTATTELTFALEVHDASLASDPVTVTITVNPAPTDPVPPVTPETPDPDGVSVQPRGCGCGATPDAGQLFGALPLLALAAARFRRRRR